MKTLTLVIGVVRKGDAVLMRKKPAGSPPYQETWYVFGAQLDDENPDPGKAIADVVLRQAGIVTKMTETLFWDTEIKADKDGEPALHAYLDCLCEYVSGDLAAGEGIERVEWVPIADLGDYDIVPPSRKLFGRLGYR